MAHKNVSITFYGNFEGVKYSVVPVNVLQSGNILYIYQELHQLAISYVTPLQATTHCRDSRYSFLCVAVGESTGSPQKRDLESRLRTKYTNVLKTRRFLSPPF